MPPDPYVRALSIRGYRQGRNYACGYASSLMVLRYYYPDTDGREIFHRLGTDRGGTSQSAIVRTLRESGLQVSLRYKLDFKSMVRAIDQNKLIIGYLFKEEHWLVIYGYGRCPERLLVVDPRPGFEKHEHTFAEYGELLRGFGMLCARQAKPDFAEDGPPRMAKRAHPQQLLLPLGE